MLFKNKDGTGECPFAGFKPCRESCVFYRRGMRYFTDSNKDPEEFVDCSINVLVDNLEQIHTKIYMLQKEVGDTKNIMGSKILMEMGLVPSEEAQSQVIRTLEPGIEYKENI